MAQVTERRARPSSETPSTSGQATTGGPSGSIDRWVGGALAGGLAAVLFSVVVPPQEMMPMVAALYGLEGVVWGWVFHLLHGVAFGLAFAALASLAGIASGPAGDSGRRVALGAVFGVVIWVIFAAIVMPAWIGAVTDMDPPVPAWNRLSLVAHVVYGVAVAALLPALASADRTITGRRG